MKFLPVVGFSPFYSYIDFGLLLAIAQFLVGIGTLMHPRAFQAKQIPARDANSRFAPSTF